MVRIEEIIVDPNAGKDLSSSEFFIPVVILSLDSKLTSKCLVLLSDVLSLSSFGLDHLKRVRKSERTSSIVQVVLGPADTVASLHVEFWEKLGLHLTQAFLDHPDVSIQNVPRYPPNNRQEFLLWGQCWPVNYHPGELERCRSKGLSEDEHCYVQQMISLLIDCASKRSICKKAALLANPISGREICTSGEALDRLSIEFGDNIHRHPLYTPTMLAIDQLAAISRHSIPGQGN